MKQLTMQQKLHQERLRRQFIMTANALGNSAGVRIVFGGSPCTNGSRIVLNTPPDDWSEKEQTTFLGNLAHECGHLRFTTFSFSNEAKSPFEHTVENALEDCRIEREMNRIYRGAEHLFRESQKEAVLSMIDLSNELVKEPLPVKLATLGHLVPTYLIALTEGAILQRPDCRAAANAIEPILEETLGSEVAKRIGEIALEVKDATCTRDVRNLRKRIIEELRNAIPENPSSNSKPKKEQASEGQQSQKQEQSEHSQSGQSNDQHESESSSKSSKQGSGKKQKGKSGKSNESKSSGKSKPDADGYKDEEKQDGGEGSETSSQNSQSKPDESGNADESNDSSSDRGSDDSEDQTEEGSGNKDGVEDTDKSEGNDADDEENTDESGESSGQDDGNEGQDDENGEKGDQANESDSEQSDGNEGESGSEGNGSDGQDGSNGSESSASGSEEESDSQSGSIGQGGLGYSSGEILRNLSSLSEGECSSPLEVNLEKRMPSPQEPGREEPQVDLTDTDRGRLVNFPRGKERLDKARTSASALMQSLAGVIRGHARVGHYLSTSGRKIDSGRIARIACGNTRVFKHREEAKTEAAAVHILLDLSGSMEKGETDAITACLGMLQALEKFPEVSSGFSVFPAIGSDSYRDMAEAEEKQTRCITVKGHNEQLSNRDVIGRIGGLRSLGRTPLATALKHGRIRLLTCPNPKKVLFVITDGVVSESDWEPADQMRLEGHKVFGIFIDQPKGAIERAKPHLTDGVAIESTSELKRALFEFARRSL